MKALKLIPALAASVMLIAGSGAMAANYYSSAPPANAAGPTAKAPAAKAPAVKHTGVRTPESIQCSKEADAKGLHGRDRVKFRAACKSALRNHKPIPEQKS